MESLYTVLLRRAHISTVGRRGDPKTPHPHRGAAGRTPQHSPYRQGAGGGLPKPPHPHRGAAGRTPQHPPYPQGAAGGLPKTHPHPQGGGGGDHPSWIRGGYPGRTKTIPSFLGGPPGRPSYEWRPRGPRPSPPQWYGQPAARGPGPSPPPMVWSHRFPARSLSLLTPTKIVYCLYKDLIDFGQFWAIVGGSTLSLVQFAHPYQKRVLFI